MPDPIPVRPRQDPGAADIKVLVALGEAEPPPIPEPIEPPVPAPSE